MKDKLRKNKRVLFFVLAIFALAIFVFGKRNILEDNILQAEEVACKGPADVMLLIDRSASMNENSKFSIAKSSSAGFIDKLFSTTPNAAFSPYDYHQAGLMAFNQNIDSEPLTQNGSYIKDVINSNTGILSQAIGYRNTADAIKEARTKLNASMNNFSTKTMIILTDGPPANLTSAKQKSDQAKSAGIRIISIGLKLDGIIDETEKTEAEDFIRYAASSPADCYYVSDSGSGLADCNSISSAILGDALDSAYNTITAGLCDNSSPVVNISRIPAGTLYSSDKLIIKSTAADDTGFSSHKIIWSDNWPSNLYEVICGNLSGTTINCSTSELGPFAANKIISYRSTAKDVNNNVASINPPDPRIVQVANVSLIVPALRRNTSNSISVSISDPEGKANLDEFYIRVDNDGVKRIDEISPSSKMNCSGTGSNYNCAYSFNPGCASAGIYPANAADIYIYAKSVTGYHPNPIAYQLNKALGLPSEGVSWGNCGDGIDNDCDGLVDLAEISCDSELPLVVTTRTNPIETSEVYDDDASITLKSDATDSSGIKRNTIYYRITGSPVWTTAFNCNDANVDGKCDDDITQNISNVSVIIDSIFPALAGTGVQYYSQAIDYSGNNNASVISIKSFIVKSRECDGVSDLGVCNITLGGKCCALVCNAAISNTNSYNTTCAKEICNGTSWQWGSDVSKNSVDCSDGANSDGCYPYGTFFDGGCENRNYSCSGGYCVPAVSNRNGDYCVGGGSLILNDYECVGGLCALSPNPAIENDICDVILDSLSMNGYNSDNVLISGNLGVVSGEVLDNKTNKVSLISNVADINGISEHKIYWRENGGGWSNKNCGTCPDGNICNCDKDIGHFNVGDVVNFYARAKDNSPNKTERTTATYSFTVRDSDCYNIPGGNKASLTACGPESSTSGKCCVGSCDTSVSSTSYNEECRVDACSGTNWVYAAGNEGNLCGAEGTCFDYYTGCISGNKCVSGYCSPDLSGKKIDICAGSFFDDFGCSGGVCGLISGGLDCSLSENSDGDSLACNCDCNGYDIEEKVYSSLSFDGVDDYVGIPSNISTSDGATAEAWVKSDEFSDTYGTIYLLGSQSSSQGYSWLFISSGAINWQYGAEGGWQWKSVSTSWTAGQWYHLVVAHDYAKKEIMFYRNGVLLGTATHTQNILPVSNKASKIGAYSPSGHRFKGFIDEVRIYNRALYPEEVSDHFKGIYANNTGLKGYWNFNEGTGEIANDSSGNGNNGTLNNGPNWEKHYHGSVSGSTGTVPIYWQVCADSKDNDCDGVVDEYNIGDISNAQCDGIVDNVFVQAAAKDRSGVQKIFIKPTTEVFDIDTERINNDFTLSTMNADDFGIKQTVIEWTVDNWANRGSKTCSSGACYACVIGGTCENESTGVAESAGNKTLIDNDKLWVIDEWGNGAIEIISGTGTGQTKTIISNTEEKITVDSNWSVNPDATSQYKLSKRGDVVNPLLLSADNTFTYRTCAWDFNNNKSCAADYSFVVLSSNLAPILNGLSVWNPDFCVVGLKYILKWVYSDADGDAQASYEIQVKEGNNDFSDDGTLIINTIKYLSSNYYQILSDDFELGKEIEYGNKDYYWRVRATDDRGGGYAKTSDWIECPSFTTPLYKYPSVDFSAIPNCLYGTDYVYTGIENRCNFGEDLLFSDDSLFVDCTNPDSSQCGSGRAPKCDTNILSCMACDDNSQCVKFGAGYTCQSGNCEPPIGFLCAIDNDCLATNISKCDAESGACAACDDDSQCAKFNDGGTIYVCRSNGKCEDSERREWYFYGDDTVPPSSSDPYPVNKYVISVVDSYNVILKVRDISGNLCSKTKTILFGGKKYPKWNEVSPTNN